MILIYILLYILITAVIIYYLYSILNNCKYEPFTSTRYIENKVLPHMINTKSYYIVNRTNNQCLTNINGILQMQSYQKNNTVNQQWQFKKERLSNSSARNNGLEILNNVLRYRAGQRLNSSNLTYQDAINYVYRNLSPNDAFLIQQKNKNSYIYLDKQQFKLSPSARTNYTLNLKGIRYETRTGWYWSIKYIVQPLRWFFWFLSRIFYRVFRITIRLPYYYTVAIPYYINETLTIDNFNQFTRFVMKNNKLGYIIDSSKVNYIQIDKDNQYQFDSNINKITTEWYIIDAIAIERYYEDNKPIVANKEFKKSIQKSVQK